VLFSEPKIPQWFFCAARARFRRSFSALQRAENSSIHAASPPTTPLSAVSVLFSEPKIPQSLVKRALSRQLGRFSALQRAENSSMPSSDGNNPERYGFSALQRAENSSMNEQGWLSFRDDWFQCSSASRKFLNRASFSVSTGCPVVSVLFSEPKIPQLLLREIHLARRRAFQCSSASRKFLNHNKCVL